MKSSFVFSRLVSTSTKKNLWFHLQQTTFLFPTIVWSVWVVREVSRTVSKQLKLWECKTKLRQDACDKKSIWNKNCAQDQIVLHILEYFWISHFYFYPPSSGIASCVHRLTDFFKEKKISEKCGFWVIC